MPPLERKSGRLADTWLVAQAALLIAFSFAAVRLAPFSALRRLLLFSRSSDQWPAAEAGRLVKAVARAARHMPAARCLEQAMAAKLMLGMRAIPARLRIGVSRTSGGELEAHAWVENDTGVLIGGNDSPRWYAPLPPFDIQIES